MTSNTDGSAVAMNSDLTGIDVTIQSDIDNKKYIETSESNILWNYNDSSTLSINNQYLYGYYEYWSREIKLSSSSSSWEYTGNKLKTTYSIGSKTYSIYVSYYKYYSNYYFEGSSSGSNIYLYSLDDIKVETFSYLNSTSNEEDDIETTEDDIVKEEITETEQAEETYTLVDELVVDDTQIESQETVQSSEQSEEVVSE